MNIYTKVKIIRYRIEDFIKWCSDPKKNYTLYFHNLKFDSEFIFNYLLNNGYEVIKDKKEKRDKTFTTLISDMNQIYSIEIYFDCHNPKHVNKVTIYDSLKILNFSVDQIAKDFNLPIRTITLDRGSEFADFRNIEKDLDTTIYFADLRSPWQRGLNENTNDGQIEQITKKH